MDPTQDLHIVETETFISPREIKAELPITTQAAATVVAGREDIKKILQGQDDRMMVVIGPCSIHDPKAALEYAGRLEPLRQKYKDRLHLVMRVYFEKPRTVVGWKGLINDPHLDGSFAINDGLHLARRFLLDVVNLGVPAGSEFLDPISPQFIADLVSWGAIGARTSESQVHRELASGLSMPVGFKNGTTGTIQIAIDAIGSAANPHHFLSVSKQGVAAIVATKGNDECHVILRGGNQGPNYDAANVASTCDELEGAGLPRTVMIDCSHANSGKDHRRQPGVAAAVAAQVSDGNRSIVGVMLESFLEDGRQDVEEGGKLVHGQSITDACMGWERTVPVLDELAGAVRQRRG